MSHSIQLGPSGEVVAERSTGPTRAVQVDRSGAASDVTHNSMTQVGQDLAATERARQMVLRAQQEAQGEPEEPDAPDVADAPSDALPAEYVEAATTLGQVAAAHNIDLERVVGHVANTGELPAQVQQQILAGFSGDVDRANAALGALEDRVLGAVLDQADALGLQDDDALFEYLGSAPVKGSYQKAYLTLLRSGDARPLAQLVHQFHSHSTK